MTKQKQASECRAAKEKQPQSQSLAMAEEELTDGGSELTSPIARNSVSAQAAWLSDGRLPSVQRRALAAQRGETQGNRHLQGMITQRIQQQNSRSIQLEQSSIPRRIKVWINTFIPFDKIDGPPGSDCFLGDNRGFSNDPIASSRSHQEIEFDVETLELTINYKNVGESHEVSCATGQLIEKGRASRDGLINGPVIRSGREILVRFSAEIRNPLFLPAPHIDILYANFIINPIKRTCVLGIQHDGFPAYEAYIAVKGGAGIRVYSHDPRQTGEGISSLWGWGDHTVRTNLIRF